MHKLVELSEKAEAEVGKIANKSDLSLVDIEAACKAVKLMKEIEEVLAMRNSSMMEDDMMYQRSMPSRMYKDSYSSMPRNHYGVSSHNNYRGIDYGHGTEKDMMVDKLENMMTSSGNEQHRQIIAEAVDRINRLGN